MRRPILDGRFCYVSLLVVVEVKSIVIKVGRSRTTGLRS